MFGSKLFKTLTTTFLVAGFLTASSAFCDCSPVYKWTGTVSFGGKGKALAKGSGIATISGKFGLVARGTGSVQIPAGLQIMSRSTGRQWTESDGNPISGQGWIRIRSNDPGASVTIDLAGGLVEAHTRWGGPAKLTITGTGRIKVCGMNVDGDVSVDENQTDLE